MLKNHFLYERVYHYIKHKVLWNINRINYIGLPLMVLSKKRLCSRDRLEAVWKKENRTRKDTKNVRCLILWDSLWIYIRSKIPMSRFRSQGFLRCWVMIYDRRSTEKQVAIIYSFITPGVTFFKNFPFFCIFSVKKIVSLLWELTSTLRSLIYKRRFSFKYQRVEVRTFDIWFASLYVGWKWSSLPQKVRECSKHKEVWLSCKSCHERNYLL